MASIATSDERRSPRIDRRSPRQVTRPSPPRRLLGDDDPPRPRSGVEPPPRGRPVTNPEVIQRCVEAEFDADGDALAVLDAEIDACLDARDLRGATTITCAVVSPMLAQGRAPDALDRIDRVLDAIASEDAQRIAREALGGQVFGAASPPAARRCPRGGAFGDRAPRRHRAGARADDAASRSSRGARRARACRGRGDGVGRRPRGVPRRTRSSRGGRLRPQPQLRAARPRRLRRRHRVPHRGPGHLPRHRDGRRGRRVRPEPRRRALRPRAVRGVRTALRRRPPPVHLGRRSSQRRGVRRQPRHAAHHHGTPGRGRALPAAGRRGRRRAATRPGDVGPGPGRRRSSGCGDRRSAFA